MEDGHKAEVFFGVHVHYADGASAEDVLKTYLAPLEIRYEEHEGFSESVVIFLMREQIYIVKCPLRFSLVTDSRTEKYAYTTAKNSNKESL